MQARTTVGIATLVREHHNHKSTMILRFIVLTVIIAACFGCKCSNYIPQTAACHADIAFFRGIHNSIRSTAAANLLGRENFSFNITDPHGTSCSMDFARAPSVSDHRSNSRGSTRGAQVRLAPQVE
ncbi:hypothetical protein B566_EDAN014948 [Ephemera danica]|nr:hypothetical protein B566_EDAN014948 [Ephemera danica]